MFLCLLHSVFIVAIHNIYNIFMKSSAFHQMGSKGSGWDVTTHTHTHLHVCIRVEDSIVTHIHFHRFIEQWKSCKFL